MPNEQHFNNTLQLINMNDQFKVFKNMMFYFPQSLIFHVNESFEERLEINKQKSENKVKSLKSVSIFIRFINE